MISVDDFVEVSDQREKLEKLIEWCIVTVNKW